MKTTVRFLVLLIPMLGLLGYLAPRYLGHNHTHDEHHHHDASYTEPWTHPERYPDRIALTWSQDPATTLSVSWRTDTTITSAQAQIAIATPAPRFDRNASTHLADTERLDPRIVENEDVVAHYHTVTFTNLNPETLYAYRVGDGEIWSEWFHAKTASANPESFSFIYFGDAQNGIQSHWSRNIRAAYAEDPNVLFVLHAGDLVNRAHRNVEWGEWFYAGSFIHSMLPSIAIPGNHEYSRFQAGGERQLSLHWRPQFALPENGPDGLEETVYYIDIQGVRFVGLNSNRDHEIQATWLEQVLADNPNDWTIVTHHHPIYSSSGDRDNPHLRELWKPLYDQYQVDLVLQGHDHSYARGRDINVADGVTAVDANAGTVYVNSVSGSKMYNIKENRWDQYGAVMERAAENTQLFQIITVSPDTLNFRAYDVTGTLYDAFDLAKQGNGPNQMVAHPQLQSMPERTHENTVPYKTEED